MKAYRKTLERLEDFEWLLASDPNITPEAACERLGVNPATLLRTLTRHADLLTAPTEAFIVRLDRYVQRVKYHQKRGKAGLPNSM